MSLAICRQQESRPPSQAALYESILDPRPKRPELPFIVPRLPVIFRQQIHTMTIRDAYTLWSM